MDKYRARNGILDNLGLVGAVEVVSIAVKLEMEPDGDEEEDAELLRVNRHFLIDAGPDQDVIAEKLHNRERKVEEEAEDAASL